MNYDDIRPYNLQEVYEVFRKLSKLQTIRRMYEIFMPGVSMSTLEAQASMLTSIDEFQRLFILPGVNKIIDDTTSGITFSGFEKLKQTQSYLFISNHRDIVLDSTFFETILHNLGFNTTETAIGDNLLKSKVIKEVAKINKTITVMRDGSVKDLYKSALKLSAYIRETISTNRSSIWIAQRNGRTKDGNDLTQPGLLKMLFINCDSVIDFANLNIVPLSINYEFEPCDHLKVLETFKSIKGNYIKQPGEDLNSIITGVKQFKGRIHLAVGNLMNTKLKKIKKSLSVNDKLKELARLIDFEIYRNYRLFPNNYIAYDLLYEDNTFNSYYTESDKDSFIQYFHKKIALTGEKNPLIKQFFLQLYANPVINQLAILKSEL